MEQKPKSGEFGWLGYGAFHDKSQWCVKIPCKTLLSNDRTHVHVNSVIDTTTCNGNIIVIVIIIVKNESD